MAKEPVDSFARIGSFASMFQRTTEDAYLDYLKLKKKLDVLDDDNTEAPLIEYNRDSAAIQAIVFSTMCFEAAIYDFAAIHLGDEYVAQHLDKLDLLSKWLVIPQLVSGIELNKGEAPYGALKQLIKQRNRLVHAKSEPLDLTKIDDHNRKISSRKIGFDHAVHNAFKSLVLMSLYFDEALNTYYNPLLSYQKFNLALRVDSSELLDVVNKCRSLIKYNN